MKHLQYFLDTANSATLTAKYTGFINAQASGIVHYATGAGYTVSHSQSYSAPSLLTSCFFLQVGSVWYAGNAGKCFSLQYVSPCTEPNTIWLYRRLFVHTQVPVEWDGRTRVRCEG